MMRNRLVWFSLGVSVSAAAIWQVIWKDVVSDRAALFNHMNNGFDTLQQRLHNLDSSSNSSQVDA